MKLALDWINSQRNTCLLLLFVACAVLADAQPAVLGEKPLSLSLAAKQDSIVSLRGKPDTFQLLEIQISGGLFSVTSPNLPPWPLELGQGGQVRYVVLLSHAGSAELEFHSREESRVTSLRVLKLDAPSQPELSLLYETEQCFLKGEGARRHLPGAPDPQVALENYDRAILLARQGHDTAFLRLILTQKARFLLFAKSDFTGARSILLEAEQFPDANDTAQQAQAFKTEASAEIFLDNYDAAISAGERALDLYRQTGDVYWQGVVLGNLISPYEAVGQIDRATQAGRLALEDAKASEDPAGVVFSLSELADVYRQQGNFQAAFQSFRDGIGWAERIHYAPLIQAQMEEALGAFYADLGMDKEAEESLHDSLLHLGSLDNTTSLEARGLLALVLQRRKQYRAAIREYDASIATAEALKAPSEQLRLLLGRAEAEAMSGDHHRALADVTLASAIADRLQAPVLLVKVALTRGAIANNPKDSLLSYRAALTEAEKTGEQEATAAALAGCARAQLQLKDAAGALDSIQQALRLVEQERSELGSRDVSGSYTTEHHSWYELAIAAAMQQAAVEPGKGYEATAFLWAERSRARSLLDSVGERAGQPLVNLPSGLRRNLALNRHAIQEQEAALENSHADTRSIAEKLRRLYHEQAALEAEERTLARQSGGSDRLELHETSSVREIQRTLLTPKTALVAFYAGQNQSYRWLLTQHALSTTILPGRSMLERQFTALLAVLTVPRPGIQPGESAQDYSRRQKQFLLSRTTQLEEAGRLLLRDLPQGVHELYLVADGPLLSLPWSALRIPCGTHTCYVLERYAVTNEPSASIALSLARETSVTPTHRIALISDSAPVSEDLTAQPYAQPLPGAHREVRTIALLANKQSMQVVSRDHASPAMVETLDAREYDVLHIAAHTRTIMGHPELSGIALTRTVDDPGSVLWLRDIAAMHAPPLVVLSGCQTEGGKYFAGESLQSLAQAFFFAGANQVIGTLWNVDDNEAAAFMQLFYIQLLERHRSASEALHAAQVQAFNKGQDLYTWGAFVANGVVAETPNGVTQRATQ